MLYTFHQFTVALSIFNVYYVHKAIMITSIVSFQDLLFSQVIIQCSLLAGDLINGKIKFQKNSHDYRSLDISLSLELVSPGLNDGVPVTRIQKLTLS